MPQQIHPGALKLTFGRLPFDVIEEIISLLGFDTLKALNLVNRAFHDQTNGWLWHSITYRYIRNDFKTLHSSLERLNSAVARDKQRASYVRKVTFHIALLLDPPPSGPASRISRALKMLITRRRKREMLAPPAIAETALCDILRSMPNLRHLLIDIEVVMELRALRFGISNAMSTHSLAFPFRLGAFETSLPFHPLIPFLETQSEITSYKCISSGSKLPWEGISIPPTILPLLESAGGESSELKYLIPGRPVHSLDVQTWGGPLTLTFIPLISVCSRPLTHLSFEFAHGNLASVLTILAPHLSALVSLECNPIPWWFSDEAEAPTDIVPSLVDALELLPILRRIVWVDYPVILSTWRNDFADATRRRCPSLLRVEYQLPPEAETKSASRRASYFQLERTSMHSEWQAL